ncbi:hypothetical protein BC832DRAFT_174359 [Gaertneriomyces semiglobifer]|nr:hypothetical protein BC832DRAFT_174359 [Gaertneriomyces semiglobifer]
MSLIPIQGTLQPSAAVNAMPPTLPSQDPLLPAQWSFFALAANQYTGFVIQYSSTIDPTPIQVPAEGFYPMNPADPNQVVPSAEQPIESDVPAVPKEENFVDKDALKYAAIVVAAITVLFAGCLITISCRNASAASRAYPKREQSRSRPSNAGPPDVEEIVVMPRNSQDPVRQQP